MAPLRFGYFELPITPDLEVPLEGYLHRGVMGLGNGPVLDDLTARGLTLEVDGARVLLLTLDLCLIEPALALEMRRQIARVAGIPETSVLLATTHTHSGPALSRVWGARDLTPEAADRAAGLMRSYTERLLRACRTVALESAQQMYAGSLRYAELRYTMGYNRRLVPPRGGGEALMLFSLWEYPDHAATGVTDDVIPIVEITRDGGENLDRYNEPSGVDRVVLFAASSHPVCLGEHSRAISADYPGAARRAIERWLGQGTRAVFLMGPCGDTQPFLSSQQNPNAHVVVGEALGAAVVSRLAGRRPIATGALEIREESIPFTRDQAITVQCIRIGDLRIASVSAECFAELGIGLRARLPGVPLIIATDANGAAGYVPTSEAFASGGYEIEQARAEGIPPDMLRRLQDRIVGWIA